MNDKSVSEIVTFLLECQDVKTLDLSWVNEIDDMLMEIKKSMSSDGRMFITDIISKYMPQELVGAMLNDVYITKYTSHLSYAISTRDCVRGVAVIIMAAVATGQPVYISEDLAYADVICYRYRASLRRERFDDAALVWQAFLARYLSPREPLASELDSED